MAISDTIQSMQTNIENAYSAISTKGGTVPANKNLQNLSTAISSISTGGGGSSKLPNLIDGSITSVSAEDFGNATSIRDNAFRECYSLVSVSMPSSITRIGEDAFNSCGLTSIEIGTGVTYVGQSAFSGCNHLISVTIPSGLTSISGGYVFNGCSSLASVYYLGTLAQWCNMSFGSGSNPLQYAHNLYINNTLQTDIIIPDTITQIKPRIFYGASCLTSVTFPAGITSIGNEAFYGCNGVLVYDFTASTSVPTLGTQVFTNRNINCKIIVPDDLYSSWVSASGWSSLSSCIIKASEV